MQVVAVTLLPAALVFLILLLNDKPLMGKYVNTRWQNFVNWVIVIFVIVMSTIFAVSVVISWLPAREVFVVATRVVTLIARRRDDRARKRAEARRLFAATRRTIASSTSPIC